MKEEVLVLKSEDLSLPEGLVFMKEPEAISLLRGGFFLERSLAEFDERYRQVIPYVVLLEGRRVLLVRRTERQSEKRLHNLYSIGIGGHIRKEDGKDPIEAFRKGMMREINEEVDADVLKLHFIGLINDLSKPVSRVHLGYLYVADATIRGMKEKELFEWKMVDLEELEFYKEGMENWSRIAMDGLKYHLSRS